VNPVLVLPDKEGKPYTVHYDGVNAMWFNKFLKEHRKVEQLKDDLESEIVRIILAGPFASCSGDDRNFGIHEKISIG